MSQVHNVQLGLHLVGDSSGSQKQEWGRWQVSCVSMMQPPYEEDVVDSRATDA